MSEDRKTYGGAATARSPLCTGEHRYFVACEAIVEEEGKVSLLGLCLHCKDPLQLDFKVASPFNSIRLEKVKEKSDVNSSF